ncbi:preprotein translocase subunit SecG [Aestuariivirga sp. YIM B02566]|uniref:Preprotein translocase subunit SecG n=1 Tax=Taklimakanibacter albus TaxID=2800327 RepID=A0ACC5R1H3_9HYPH|nr:preprotein translocase subunit SecG [Aestuariivirga sp. YIM B02566]MBK1866485.1 preprotein translocase subunit SecG [Aestuariivirga sp. YIM B02566]
MQTVLLVAHLIIALALIAVVLLQRSEGGALGIGGGGGGSLFSARGVGNTLTRTTAILAVAFFITSIGLTLLSRHTGGGSLFNNPTTQQNQTAPGDSGLPQLPPAGQNQNQQGGGTGGGGTGQPQVPVSQ